MLQPFRKRRLEGCFDLWLVEAVHLEFLGLWTFLLGRLLESECKLCKSVVYVTVCAGHDSGVHGICRVSGELGCSPLDASALSEGGAR